MRTAYHLICGRDFGSSRRLWVDLGVMCPQCAPVIDGLTLKRQLHHPWRAGHALRLRPDTVIVTSSVRASTWTRQPLLFTTPLPGDGTTAPPWPGYESVTPVRSHRACGTVTGTWRTVTREPGRPQAGRNSGGTAVRSRYTVSPRPCPPCTHPRCSSRTQERA